MFIVFLTNTTNFISLLNIFFGLEPNFLFLNHESILQIKSD